MNEELIARLSRRYLALDIHKHYSVVAGVNFEGQVVVEPVRIEHADLEVWLAKHIQPTNYVVIESTTNAWHIYDLLEPLAEKVLVANPIKVKQIAQTQMKTDIGDILILARLLADNMVPVIWVPPLHVRTLRYLLSQRRYLAGMHTQTVNRMHSVAHRHHLNHPKGKRFNKKNTKWQQDDELSDSEKFQIELNMSTKEHLAEQAEKITKEWHKDLRWATLALHCVLCSAGVMKVARLAVKSEPLWKHRFIELCRRMHKNQAIVAIARRLLELIWYVLSRIQAYRNFSHERIAYKYLTGPGS